MRRLVSAMAAALLATGLGVGTARAGGDVCVGGGHGCHRTLQAALDAARDGDTIRIAPGTYPGGATIDKSVRVHGAGAGRTIIRGGGPVLTIGTFGADSEPTVLLSGLTITGGMTRSSPSRQGEPLHAQAQSRGESRPLLLPGTHQARRRPRLFASHGKGQWPKQHRE
jgi:hypothetical protein